MPTPSSWGDSVPVSPSGSTNINALLSDARWASGNISYSFPGANAAWSTDFDTGYGPSTDDQEPWSPWYEPLSASDQGYFTAALDAWADVAGLHFNLVAETAGNVGDIRAAYTSLPRMDDAQAWAYLPEDAAYAGDVWFEAFGTSATTAWTPGSYEYLVALHEIGHALGLTHPFESPTVLPPALDSMSFTVMSYSGQNGDASTGFNFYPTTPMILDIAAIQHLYGANSAHRAGSDTYAYSSATRYHETIWDTGGVDSIEYSGTLGVTIDLRSGVTHGSRIGLPVYATSRDDVNLNAVNNVWIADGVVIENASGGSGADTLIGNAVANVLQGGAGGDVLTGGAGNDSIDGGAMVDRVNGSDGNTASYSGSTAAVNVDLATGVAQDGLGGSDTLANINFVIGSSFRDTITGTSVAGSEIAEFFQGGPGNDTIDGGAITDIYSFLDSNRALYQGAGAAVTVDLLAGTSAGGAGNDTLLNINQVWGSSFGDTLLGSNSTVFTETFEGSGGSDLINGRGGFDIVRYGSATAAVNVNLVSGMAADGLGRTDTLLNIEGIRGSGYNDVLTGGNAANASLETFQGGAGSDTINGGAGYDRVDYNFSGAAVNVTLGGTGNGSAQDGLGGTDRLINIEGVGGSAFNDTLTGSNSGLFESFEGREGNDAINGVGGTDRADYFLDPAGVAVNLATGLASDGHGGTDTLLNIEDVRGSRDFNDSITGNAGNNLLEGQGGDDTLDGGGGNDTASYAGATAAVAASLASGTATGGAGNDSLANIENLLGGAGADTLTGDGGGNILDGGAGNDTLTGGVGNDLYVVDSAGDALIENADQGTDAVQSSVSTTLGENLENLSLSGTANLSGTGNDSDNALTGNAGANTLDGGAGADTLSGGAGNDSYVIDNTADVVLESALQGIDTLRTPFATLLAAHLENVVLTGTADVYAVGNAADNALTGNAGNNVLEGGAGNDTLAGGEGNDTYVLDNSADVVLELSLQGADTVRTPFATILPLNVENIVLTGVSSVNLTGNAQDNALTGNAGNNVLDGGAGNDTLAGGRGDDTYLKDASGDVVIESSGQGTDTLLSSVTTVLPFALENVSLSGTASVNATGNAANNVLLGNTGNNVLDGAGGLDTMEGGAGNDTYVIDRLLEQGLISDSGGIDTVVSSANYTGLQAGLENLTLVAKAWIGLGNDTANVITGTARANILVGGGGNDTLIGGGGADLLDGGPGADRFVFDTAPGASNVDFIVNFSAAQGDRIVLDTDIYGASTFGVHILFDPGGALYYDEDGAGATAAVQIAVLNGVAGVGAGNFDIID